MQWTTLILIAIISITSGIYIFQRVSKGQDKLFYLVSLVYLTLLTIILFTPISFDGTGFYIMSKGVGRVNLYQLQIFELGFVENIVLTVPLGIMIKQSFSNLSLPTMTRMGLIIGAIIETIQFYLSHAFLINRSSDINDVIANGLGIVMGAALFILYERLANKRIVSAYK